MPPAVPNTDYYQAPPPAQAPVKPFDLVLEFREHPGDRWLFPRGTVCTERLTTSNNIINNADVLITMCLSNDGKVCVELDDQIVQDASPGDSGLYTASIRLKECPPYVWDILLRWIGGQDQNTMNRKQLDNLVFAAYSLLSGGCYVLHIIGSTQKTLPRFTTLPWTHVVTATSSMLS